MTEYRLFDPENPPEWLDSRWWINTPNCNHLDNRVHVARLEAAAETAERFASDYRITDLGAGDGGLLSILKPAYRAQSWGYEIISDSVRYAQEVRGVDVRQANVLIDPVELAPVVVATEMLEHLEDPHAFVRKLYADQRVKFFVASSPHSETDQHHEWNHAWAWDHQGYEELIAQGGWTIYQHFDAEWSQIVVGAR